MASKICRPRGSGGGLLVALLSVALLRYPTVSDRSVGRCRLVLFCCCGCCRFVRCCVLLLVVWLVLVALLPASDRIGSFVCCCRLVSVVVVVVLLSVVVACCVALFVVVLCLCCYFAAIGNHSLKNILGSHCWACSALPDVIRRRPGVCRR